MSNIVYDRLLENAIADITSKTDQQLIDLYEIGRDAISEFGMERIRDMLIDDYVQRALEQRALEEMV